MDIGRGHRVLQLLVPSLALAVLLTTSSATASQPCSQPTFERGPSIFFLSWTCPSMACYPIGPFTLLAMDVNRDSRPDIVVVSPNSVDVFLGQLDGTFTPSSQTSPGGQPVISADLNGDGNPDLVLAGGQLSVQFWEGGAFGAPTQIADRADAVAAGDFDGDGRTDLVIARYRWDTTPFSSDLSVLRGNRDGSFTQLPAFHLSFPVSSIAAGRFDRHPFDDIIISRLDPDTGKSRLKSLAGRGDGTFGPPHSVEDLWTGTFALEDLNGDGWPDIVASVTYLTTGQCSLRTYLGNGAGGFGSWTANLTRPEICGVSNLAFADFNGDGFLDVAGGRVVLLGDGKGGLSPPILLGPEPFWGLVPVTIATNSPSSLAALSAWGHVTPWHQSFTSIRLLLLRNDCDGPGVSATRVLPFIGSVPGRAGALFESDLSITNTGSTDADLDLRYTAAFGEGSGSASARLAAGRQITASSALGYLRSLGLKIPEERSQGGSLRVHYAHLSAPDSGVVASHTSSRGAGLWYPGGQPDAGDVFVGPLKEDASDRTNLVLVNAGAPDAGDAVLGVGVYSTDPSALGSVTLPEIRLKPGEFRQIGRILSASGLNATSGFAIVSARDSTAPFGAHAVVNDNTTSDGSYLVSVGTNVSPTLLVVPSIVEAGPYSTEIMVTNATYTSQRIRLELPAPSSDSELGARAALILDLEYQESRTIPDIFEELRRFGLVPPKGPALVRPMIVTSETGAGLGGVLVASRVRNPAPGGGTYGVFAPAVGPDEMATWSAVVSDLRQDETTRTNLAITNVGDSLLGEGEDTFRIEIFDGETATRVAALEGIAVPRKGWRQLNSVLAVFAPGTKQGWARVTRTSGSGPFVAYAVINDGARPGERTGDGSFVLGRPEQP